MKISQFFYSLQGEGLFSGVPGFFIRFPGCNLNCGSEPGARWVCDSVAQWTKSEDWTVEQLWSKMVEESTLSEEGLCKALNRGDIHVTFTGGEPLLSGNRTSITEIVKFLSTKAKRIFYEVETNGTLELFTEDAFNMFGAKNPVYINCSPKLASSGIQKEKRIVLDALSSLITNREINDVNLKFVVASYEDVTEAIELLRTLAENTGESLEDLKQHTYLMPAGASREDVVKVSPQVWEWCVMHQLKFSSRLHVIAFDRRIDI
jgi:6-pyruvoyltetrahydropterin 2'-reductase